MNDLKRAYTIIPSYMTILWMDLAMSMLAYQTFGLALIRLYGLNPVDDINKLIQFFINIIMFYFIR